MKYKTGMFGGAFDPPHIGHFNAILQAACLCEDLYIVLSYSRSRDFVPMEYRYRWLRNAFRHLENIHILLLEDTAKSKQEYDSGGYWEKGRDEIINQIQKKIDVVFCGSDYKQSRQYEKLYHCEVVYFDRNHFCISSTKIRENPLLYWQYIPAICRAYFVKKILLVGGESTGKSTLAANLALYYNTNFLKEVGRDVTEYAGSEELMIEEDFHTILLKHKLLEAQLLPYSNKLLFVDTDALTTKFYTEFLLTDSNALKRTKHLADAINGINHFDLVLFLEPTVAFVQDGTRSAIIEANREKYSQQIKDLFHQANIKYHCLSGDYFNRFEKAKEIIQHTFHI